MWIEKRTDENKDKKKLKSFERIIYQGCGIVIVGDDHSSKTYENADDFFAAFEWEPDPVAVEPLALEDAAAEVKALEAPSEPV